MSLFCRSWNISPTALPLLRAASTRAGWGLFCLCNFHAHVMGKEAVDGNRQEKTQPGCFHTLQASAELTAAGLGGEGPSAATWL
jgi:hypothetical protein